MNQRALEYAKMQGLSSIEIIFAYAFYLCTKLPTIFCYSCPPLPEFLSKIPDSAPVRVEAVLYVHAPLHNFITKARCFHSNVLRFCTFHNTDYVLIKNALIQDELFPTYRCIRKGLIWILQNTIPKNKKNIPGCLSALAT